MEQMHRLGLFYPRAQSDNGKGRGGGIMEHTTNSCSFFVEGMDSATSQTERAYLYFTAIA